MRGRSGLFSKVFLALTSVLLATSLLLPSAHGRHCFSTEWNKDPGKECTSGDQKLCGNAWDPDGNWKPGGCLSLFEFKDKYGFDSAKGCGEVDRYRRDKYIFACPCPAGDKPCNDETFGEKEYKAWKEGGGSTGPTLSPLLRPLTFAALLTLGALLAS